MQTISEQVFTIALTLTQDWLLNDEIGEFTDSHEMMISLEMLMNQREEGDEYIATRSLRQRLYINMLIWDGILRRPTLQFKEKGRFYRTGMVELTERGKELFGFLIL